MLLSNMIPTVLYEIKRVDGHESVAAYLNNRSYDGRSENMLTMLCSGFMLTPIKQVLLLHRAF